MRCIAFVSAVVALIACATAVPISRGGAGRRGGESSVLQAHIKGVDPDTNRNVEQLITSKGFRVESHAVSTADGFIMTLHRIPPKAKANGKVVVLQHGLMDTSATWVLNSETDSLGFMLSNAGFDVWLANSRGSQYVSHTTLKRSDSKFWDWDFDQMVSQDIPATLNFVLQTTKAATVDWVAHSQGCAISIAAFAQSPFLAQHVDRFAALAPVTWLQHESAPLMKLMVDLHLDTILSALPAGPFLPTGEWLHKVLGVACKAVSGACDGVVSGLFGATGPHLPASRTGVFFAHWPDGTSIRNIVHWIKNARSGVYGDFSGHAYDLKNYAVKTAVWAGSKDMLANPDDVATLVKQIGAPILSEKLNDYAHMDFVWSPDAARTVYPAVIKLLTTGSV